MKTLLKKIRKINYMHYICVAITISFLVCTVRLFPYALPRLVESVQAFISSMAYYFCELFEIEHSFIVTVNEPSFVPFKIPFGLPQTWEEFKYLCSVYGEYLVSSENFYDYVSFIGEVLYYVSQILLIIIPIFFIIALLFKKYFETENNDYNKDSKVLTVCKKIADYTYMPVKRWIKSFIDFVKANKKYYVCWLIIWAYNFNLFSVAISFFAFYFYFVISFDFINLYTQVYKLLKDLSVMLDFIPVFIWLIAGWCVFDLIRKKIGYIRERHYERKNCGFINSRPIVLMAVGTMGKKKTTLITDIALSQDIMFRDKAFEKILENDLKFPFFPWCNLEKAMRSAMAQHTVYNLATTKKFIRHLKFCFYANLDNPELKKSLKKHLRKTYCLTYDNLLFDYDYNRYGFTYNDELKTVTIWDVIETYAQLYFIYVIESSFIISNYSIRTDALISDLGNFPLWDSDFFKRDSKLLESYSRHSHILDFDSLRLGRKVIENNKNANSFEFGVIVITEIGKERGNNLELLEKKKKDDFANQKNDLFNAWLKLVRHSSTVDNFPFVKVITDDQRPASWGADAKELCDIIYIADKGEPQLAMPFFTVEELLYKWLFNKFNDLYYKYRYVRSDNTVPMYLLKKIVSKLNKYYIGIYNKFGYCKMTVEVEAGTMDGEREKNKYYLMNKKVYSKRFSTDCFSDFFMEKSLRSKLGLMDLQEFDSEKASIEELMLENAYFMDDILLGLKNDTKV